MANTYDPEQLSEAENTASQNTSTSTSGGEIRYTDETPESERSLYNSSSTKPGRLRFKSWSRRKKAAVGGGIATAGVGGALAFFTFISGPLQFIHLAQLMQGFHFSANEDQADDRFVKLSRYVYHVSAGKPENVRLSYTRNKFADRFESRMNKNGIQTAYTEILGRRNGYIVNPSKLAGVEFADLRNKSPAEIKSQLESRFPGIVITNEGNGKLFIDARNLGYFKNRSLSLTMMKTAGYSKVSSSIGARIMGKRAGVTWHPIRRLENRLQANLEAKYLEWKKNRAKAISQGSVVGLEAKSTPSSSDDDTAEEKQVKQGNADSAAGEAAAVADEGRAANDGINNGDDEAINKYREKLGLRMGTGAAISASSVVGVACLAKGLDEQADNIKHQQVILPLIRMGVEAIAVGNQVMSGSDVDREQLGFYNRQLNGKDSSGKKSSWSNAESIQAKTGEVKPGSRAPDETLKKINSGTPFHFLNEGNFDGATDVACNSFIQGALLAVSFLGAPLTTTANLVAGELLSRQIMPELAKWLAGKAVNPLVAGADYGNYVNYGAYLASNAQSIAAGGRELEPNEATELAVIEAQASQSEFGSNSLAYKLFNIQDYRSLVSKLSAGSSTDFGDNLSRFASFLTNPRRIFGSMQNPLSGRANAATGNYNFGVPKYGFSVKEMNNELAENPYKNAEDVINKILPAHSDYVEKAKKCFGVAIDSSSYDITSYDAGDPMYKDLNDEKNSCSDSSSDWMQLRFYIFDTQVMESAACYEGDEEACGRVGFEGIGTDFSLSQNPTTIDGTAQELALQILANPNIDLRAANFCRYCTEDIRNTAEGKPAYGSVQLDVNLLKFLADLGQGGKVDVNSITGAGSGHSSNSNHYQGTAIDFGCSLNVPKADIIGKKYGITQYKGERCPDHGHWHYSTTGN